MKRLGVLALIAIVAASSGAASASSKPSVRTSISPVLASDSNDLSSLFNGVTLTATSVSVTSGRGIPRWDREDRDGDEGPKHELLFGDHHPPIVGVDRDGWTRPSSQPIPEARSLLLYALGFVGIGWAVLRSRKAAPQNLA